MPDFKIKNLINELTEVRIIPITAASKITNTHDQLTPLDDSGYEYGIVLAPRDENIPDSDFTKVTYIKTDTSDPMWVVAEYAPEDVNGELHIDWGDGVKAVLNIADFETDGYYLYLEHEYAVNGEYVVKTYSTTKAKYVGFGEITKVTDWGSPANLQPYFNSINLIEVPSTLHPALTSLQGMFSSCVNFNQDISIWDVSHVTNMSGMFAGSITFNQDLSGWDVSNVTDMNYMFNGCVNFNQDISGWDVSNVTDMDYMFSSCDNFNQDISIWDVSHVTRMHSMFRGATAFNQDLTGWCVSNLPTKPDYFNSNSALQYGSLPIWGTCPNGV